MLMILQMLQLLAIDAALVVLLALALLPLMIYRRAAYAVLKRNFIGYFSNPTGYVFLCLFVLLTTLSAFFPHEFFSANLANLDQLNKVLPWIMLLFVSSITMSIWSEERRQGTDELLLTLPADDFDIVFGKYLAAAAIFTASLLFSQISNFAVLVSLTMGDLDVWLLFTTYLGYWLMGLAMLSVGMVASFLTNNPTIAFIFGVVLNVPLVVIYNADRVIPSEAWAQRVREWSLSANIDDFNRGVISFSGLVYFGMIIAVGIYLSMILVGRRHWMGGRDGHSMLGHYIVRATALIILALSLNVVFASNDRVLDLTEGQVSSLSPATKQVIENLNTKNPVKIDAYISANVPQEYLKTKHDLVSMLKALKGLNGQDIQVRIYDNIDPYSQQAQQADQRYGIKPQRINTQTRGSFKDEQIILGAAFTCGLEKIVIPFFETGVPVEYELVRSIATVARDQRYRIGVVRTDANMFGGSADPMAAMMGRRPSPKRAIVAELERQYTVEDVDPTNAIDASKFDALLVVQPSSLAPAQLPNLMAAIQSGVPTAIFEDPLSVFLGVPGTGQPKQGGMAMFQPQQPQEKCDIKQLWSQLGLQILGQPSVPLFDPDLVWQDYNPYPNLRFSYMGPEFVYLRNDDRPGASPSFNPDDPITKGLEEVLFPFPGGLKRVSGTGLSFEKLCTTREGISGAYPFSKFIENQGNIYELNKIRGKASPGEKIIAARISGKRKDDVQKMADDKSADDKKAEKQTDEKKKDAKNDKKSDKQEDKKKARKPGELSVVYVCDVDCMADPFVDLRNRPDQQFNFRFDNVNFVLDVLDSLAGDDRFIDIRNRKLRYSTLKLVEAETERIKKIEDQRRKEFEEEFDAAVKKITEDRETQTRDLQAKLTELRDKQQRGEPVDVEEMMAIGQNFEARTKAAQERAEQEQRRLQAKRDTDLEKNRRDFDQGIQKIQSQYKFWAVVLPPLPPLLVGLVVFVRRRLREREGISRNRLK